MERNRLFLKKYHYKNKNVTIRVSKYEFQELMIASKRLKMNISKLVRLGYLGRIK